MKYHYSNSEISALIAEYIHNERDREILRDYFINGASYEHIAGKYSLSVRRVAEILRYGRETLLPLTQR